MVIFCFLCRANALTNEELETLWKNDKIEDQIIHKLDRAIERQFFKEMMSKFLQLLDNNWVLITESGMCFQFLW